MQGHGLSQCRYHGIDGFERYTALAVLSRNIQKEGTIKRDMERHRLAKEKKKVA